MMMMHNDDHDDDNYDDDNNHENDDEDDDRVKIGWAGGFGRGWPVTKVRRTGREYWSQTTAMPKLCDDQDDNVDDPDEGTICSGQKNF